MHHVYKLVNKNGIVEYIGETKNTYQRFYCHKSTQGKFRGRDDIQLIVIKSFSTKREALDYENKLQIEYGFPQDKETHKNNALKSAFKKVPILAFCNKTKRFIGEFESQSYAAIELNLHQSSINMVLSGKILQTKGYTFKSKI